MKKLKNIIFNFQLSILNSMPGQLLIELLLAIGIAALILPAIMAGILATRDGRAQLQQRAQAVSLLEETGDAIRNIREQGWDIIPSSGTYYPRIASSGTSWELAAGSNTSNGFTTSVVFSPVYRQNGAIVLSSAFAILDPSTKRAVTTISWTQPYASSIQATQYVTRYLENNAYIETTQGNFNYTSPANTVPGRQQGVKVQATNPPALADDGEVVLSPGGGGNWCSPALLPNATDVPGNGVQKAIMANVGQVFIGTGGNASGDSVDYFTVSSTTYPVTPSATLAGSYNHYKSYGLFGDGSYAYLTSDHTGVSVDIVQITSNPYTSVGTANTGVNNNSQSIYVLSNVGYVTTTDSKLYTFNFTTKTGSHSPIGSVALAGIGNKIIVIGTYAYVAIGSTTNQLQILDVSDPTNMRVVKSVSLNAQAAQDLTINSTATRAYIVTAASSTQKELFVVNIDPTSAQYGQVLGSYEANGMSPTGVTIAPGGSYALVGGTGGENYQVVDITNDTNPNRCNGLTLPSGYNINGLAGVYEPDGDAFTYLLTTDSSKEFKMIEGGSGGAGSYVASGVFESQTFDPGFLTAKNRITVNYTQPAGTSIKFQVSLASKVLGACPQTGGYTFVGPDGTPGTYFTPAPGGSVAFPLTSFGTYTNPGQCLRYRAYLSTTNSANTPVLQDVTVNYSP